MNAIDRAARAYATAASPTRTDRGTEYDAFVRMTRKLTEASKPDVPFAQLVEALHDNRRLWTTLAAVCADDGNQLPRELRAKLFYLFEFTAEHTGKVMRREATVDALIDINRAVMEGLRHREPTR